MAFSVPTATEEEEDGTLRWDSTTIVVVELRCDGVTGLGYTYCHPAAVEVIDSKLAGALQDADPLMPERSFAEMQVQVRQLGHAGVAAMAVSAVDIALWDLKARLLGVCLADALPRYHEDVAIYGSGGFTNLSDQQLEAQLRDWLGWGAERVKIKVGRDAAADTHALPSCETSLGPAPRSWSTPTAPIRSRRGSSGRTHLPSRAFAISRNQSPPRISMASPPSGGMRRPA